ncbi:hypothetical protein GCM10009347_32250 [Shewanella algicola]|nr:hypothetical protein GCM10009347_32250 [Shewanella algicola]
MDKNIPKKKDLKEIVIVAFILLCTVLVIIDVGNNLEREINYADEMKTIEPGNKS